MWPRGLPRANIEQPESEKCRFLDDVAQKSSKKIVVVVASGGKWKWLAVWVRPAFASQNAEVFRICQISFITPCSPFGGGGFPDRRAHH